MHIHKPGEGSRHARLHVANLDCTSYPSPPASRTRLYRLSPLSDGRYHETYPRRSGPVFGTAQVAILEGAEVSSQHRGSDPGESVETTSETPRQIARSAERTPLEDCHHY